MPDGAKFTLSAFADEISPALDQQVETLKRLSVPGLDLRSVNGVNVLDLSVDDLYGVHEACKEAGVYVQSIGSPVNKVPYDLVAQGNELGKLEKAIRAAERLLVQRIRIFTPEAPENAGADFEDKVLAWMLEQKRKAVDEGVVLIVENDARYWSAYPENAKRLFGELGGPNFRAAFDFANTVLLGFRPMNDWFPWLLPHLDTLHIKDATQSPAAILPAGEGEGQIEETLEWLIRQKWAGPLTLEPHLQAAGKFGGFSGPDLMETAVEALRRILRKLGVTE
ncbi:MAG TPA: TIM barrel protein [Fimbriimonas sp.]|nr:TIM barrel protein [Fimbriimonas sp.]